ncbi:MAG: Intermembrane phospholipid transport system permease protein MlaE [Legionellaceae bacterium]
MNLGIRQIGHFTLNWVTAFGKAGIFIIQTIFQKPDFRKNFPLILEQLYFVGFLSLLITLVAGLFIGMVVGLQGYHTLEKFGATAQLGQLIALSIARELGPVVTALLFAGRAGSAITAEIGLMKTTEQLSSMEMMGVEPLSRIIAPRFWAGLISMPLLSILFCAISIIGGYIVSVIWLGLDDGTFWNNMQYSVDFYNDILSGIIKSLVFGFVATWIAVYQGFETIPTAEGIGRATTRGVVYSSLAILGLDFILTAMMLKGW